MPDPDVTAARLSRLPLPEARTELSRILGAAHDLRHGPTLEYEGALAYNARLCTRLRERGVHLWGDDGQVGE